MLCPAPVPSRDPPRSLTTTLAPSLARVSAYSRPKPPPAPVTTTTRSCTPGITFLSLDRPTDSNGPAKLEQPARQLPRLLCIRRVNEAGEVGSGRLGQHRLAVAELFEAELAVVGAQTGRPDAAERQLMGGEVEQQMVDHQAAGRHFLDHAFPRRFGLGEQVRGQRLGPRVHEFDGLIQVLNSQHRKNRAK